MYDPPPGLPETAPDFALRPYARVVGDAALADVPGLLPEERGRRLDRAVFGGRAEGALLPEPEPPGMNTLRAARNANGDLAPRLSAKWLPRRELPRVLHAALPRAMEGPDAADEMPDDEADPTDPDAVPEPQVVPHAAVPPPPPSY